MPPLSSDQRRALLALARQAILEAVLRGSILETEPGAAPGALSEPGAAFVTLYLRGHLRGCVGPSREERFAGGDGAQCAIGAALHDPRFAPLGGDEAAKFEIEISVLSALQPLCRNRSRWASMGC